MSQDSSSHSTTLPPSSLTQGCSHTDTAGHQCGSEKLLNLCALTITCERGLHSCLTGWSVFGSLHERIKTSQESLLHIRVSPSVYQSPGSCAPPSVPVTAGLTALALLLHTHLTGPCQGSLLSADVIEGNIWRCSVSHSRHLPWSTQSRSVTVKVFFTHPSQFGNTPV